MTFEFNDVGITHKVDADGFIESIEVHWKNIYQISEAKGYFYVFIGNMGAYIVPKRDIMTGSIGSLRELIKAKAVECGFIDK